MTFKDAVKGFSEMNEPFDNYCEMQQQWAVWIDLLCKQGTITQRQFSTWSNPCTPKTFKRFNKKIKDARSHHGCWFGSSL